MVFLILSWLKQNWTFLDVVTFVLISLDTIDSYVKYTPSWMRYMILQLIRIPIPTTITHHPKQNIHHSFFFFISSFPAFFQGWMRCPNYCSTELLLFVASGLFLSWNPFFRIPPFYKIQHILLTLSHLPYLSLNHAPQPLRNLKLTQIILLNHESSMHRLGRNRNLPRQHIRTMIIPFDIRHERMQTQFLFDFR